MPNPVDLRIGALLVALWFAVAGCGNSSDDDDGGPAPEPPPEVIPTAVSLLDAQPAEDSTRADPGIADVTFSHFGYSDFTIAVSGDCAQGTTIERSLEDVSADFDALFEHNQMCDSLDDTGAYETAVEATRSSGDDFEVHHAFATTTRMAPALAVQDSVAIPRDSVADLFATYLEESFVDQLELPDAVAALIEATVEELADAAFGDLVDPDPLFGVTAQRVTYASRDPDGNVSSALTGLVVIPDTASGGFMPRDSIILLSHSTGVTPSDLDVTDAWFLVASILASRGYLVIAPDNWGRGGTSTDPETFLMAKRTAANSLDLIRAVLADPAYDEVRGSSPRLTIVGYSQGGHTALAVWQAIVAQGSDIALPQVYAGAGPYDLYATARGVVQHADGSCDDDVYCRYVTDETTVPFLSERVLPGYVEYGDRSLVLEDLVSDGRLTETFVDGFLGRDTAFDRFKGQLQQSSFTNITSGLEALTGAGTTFTLFHSPFDRLVPIANSDELATVLETQFTVDFRRDACDSDAYEAVFNASDQVGISHTLCGIEMLNDVYADLK